MRLDKEVGVSYRQIDWWAKKGYIRASYDSATGARFFTDHEKHVANLMGHLVRIGFTPSAASKWARLALDTGENILDLTVDISLGVDQKLIEDRVA